jgi:hypothetical protein
MIEQLRADGWVAGQNIALEYRFDRANGNGFLRSPQSSSTSR